MTTHRCILVDLAAGAIAGDTIDFADIILTSLRGGVLVVPLCDGRGSVRYASDEGVTSG